MYIRTKDGVYEVSEKTKYAQYSIRGMTMVKNADFQYISNEKIINQSENLEELCDEGVIEVKFSSTGYIAHFNKNIDELRKFLKYLEECQPITKDEILNVYGAIYTSKGLIYVAKMDNDGKLVLI